MTVQDDPIRALGAQLHQFPCPSCGAYELMPELQCDYYPDGCLWLVRCGNCRTQYHLDRRIARAGEQLGNASVIESRAILLGATAETKGGSHANP